MRTLKTTAARRRRHARVRKRVVGTTAKPRLAVFRSNRHIYAQLIDDTTGTTLASGSTLDPQAGVTAEMTKSQAAKAVGALLGRRAVEAGVGAVVFDRGGYKYHGRVREIADAAREAGLTF